MPLRSSFRSRGTEKLSENTQEAIFVSMCLVRQRLGEVDLSLPVNEKVNLERLGVPVLFSEAARRLVASV